MERAVGKKLWLIAKKKKRLAIGLMSGTSTDGVDLALVEISGRGLSAQIKLLNFATYPYSPKIRERLLNLNKATAEGICEMNFILGKILATCVKRFINRNKYPPQKIDFIGSHGHTAYHLSQIPGKMNSTLQIGEGAVIAAQTGILTVYDFRPADIAAGGLGAPLVPYADYLLFHKKGAVRAFLNIGGIANVTVVPENFDEVLAFDTGPGNMIIDSLVRWHSKGKKKLDVQGQIAAQGNVNESLLKELLKDPYFQKKPPKSTGREVFGEVFVKKILNQAQKIPFPDLIATATHLTALSIYEAFQRFIFPRFLIEEIFVSGGGLHNQTLMNLLSQFFQPIPIRPLDSLGVKGDAKEAIAFALLADATIQGIPGNVLGATGAKKPALLGKIVIP